MFVEEQSRELFLQLAIAAAFSGQAKLYTADEVDPEAHGVEIAKAIASFDTDWAHAGCQHPQEALARRINEVNQNAPMRRIERQNEPIGKHLWRMLSNNSLFWQTGTCVLTGRLSAIWSGIEFDLNQAGKFGVQIRSRGDGAGGSIGRRPGTGMHQAADALLVPKIADRVSSGASPSIAAAIKFFAKEIGGSDDDGKVKRLRPKVRAELGRR